VCFFPTLKLDSCNIQRQIPKTIYFGIIKKWIWLSPVIPFYLIGVFWVFFF